MKNHKGGSFENLHFLLGILGLIVSGYVSSLKLLNIGCPVGTGCDGVLNSDYSTVFSIPVSIISGIIWAGYLSGDRKTRAISSLILSTGTLYFFSIQHFILSEYCFICIAHGVIAFLTVSQIKHLTTPFALSTSGIKTSILGMTTFAPLVLIHLLPNPPSNYQLESVSEIIYDSSNQLATPLQHYSSRRQNSNILVVSIACPACFEKLIEYEQFLVSNPDATVPAFIWDPHGSDFKLSLVISYIRKNPDNLKPLIDWLRVVNGRSLSDQTLRVLFKSKFPTIVNLFPETETIEYYKNWLSKHTVRVVPSLITKNGNVSSTFSVGDISASEYQLPSVSFEPKEIDLGVRKPSDHIEFSFLLENTGSTAIELKDKTITSLPAGFIKWSSAKILPGKTAEAKVRWKMPQDYYGEAFARVHYQHQGIDISVPVHVLVPKFGWVWPTTSVSISQSQNTTIRFRNVNDSNLALRSATANLSAKLLIEDSTYIRIIDIEPPKNGLNDPTTMTLNVIDTEDNEFDVPIKIRN